MIKIPDEIKALFKKDNVPKNIRIHFPNGEHEDITNENVIEESMVFTESICSQENLKFGLCESNVLQLETVGVGNIKGCTIEVDLEVAYNLPDVKYTAFDSYETTDETATVVKTIEGLQKEIAIGIVVPSSMQPNYTCKIQIENQDTGETTTTYEYLNHSATIKKLCGSGKRVVTIYLYNLEATVESISLVAESGFYPVPLGTFIVDSCTKQYRANRRYVVAYSQNLNDDETMPISELEQIKRECFTVKDVDYDYNLLYNVFANVPNMDRDVYLERSDVELPFNTYSWEGYYWDSETGRQATVEITSRNFTFYNNGNESGFNAGTELEPDALYAFIYGKRDGCDASIQRINELCEKGNFSSETGAKLEYIDKNTVLGIRHPYIEFYKHHYTKGFCCSEKLPYENNQIIYPYIAGMLDGSNKVRFTVRIPSILTLVWDDTHETERLQLYQTTDGYKYVVKDDAFNVRMSHKRTLDTEYGVHYHMYEEIPISELTSAFAEMNGVFGRSNRYGEVEFIGINKKFNYLYPSETLYPSDSLFPNGSEEMATATHYLSLWTDDYEVQPFGRVVVKYKDSEGEYQTYVHEFDAEAKNTYYMEDNYFLLNSVHTEEEVIEILNTYFVPNIKGITYVPAELSMKGLPHIEAGDVLSVLTREGGFELFVFRRTMTGIKGLIDDIEAKGDEINKSRMSGITQKGVYA